MKTDERPLVILMADDDADDRLMTKEALEESGYAGTLICVEDGVELLQYLRKQGGVGNAEAHPRPNLILLDLNMPRKDGREALTEIKGDPDLRRIPVVIFTTSSADQDILQSYDLGANSFVVKPVSFPGLVELMTSLSGYWTHTVERVPH